MRHILSSTVLAFGLLASPVFAQTDNVANQAGLVNVAVGDVASGNQVIAQVPIGIAAQVCGTSAAVLAKLEAGETACDITQEQATAAGIDGGPGKGTGQGGNKANQAGLVNVAIGDVASGNQVIAQVPIQLAAQVCGTNVGVLAQLKGDDTACTITQEQATEAGIDG